MKKRILTVLGARPQFVKAAALSRCIARGDHPFEEAIVHTGQHYDEAMSASFFAELAIPEPRWNLKAGGGSHGAQMGAMLTGLEQVLSEWMPDVVLVYGDTNSTLAGALAAAKAGLQLAHVEAGLRSFRRGMPEEVNRIVCDRLSDHLFCPTETAVGHLRSEGRSKGVHLVGDVMYDTFLYGASKIDMRVPERLGLVPKRFVLTTIHRAENTDRPELLRCLFDALGQVARTLPVVLPIHPRTRKSVEAAGITPAAGMLLIDPQPYGAILSLMMNAALIATDSGGMQKEAYFAAVPCVTLREETEWVETLASGWNRLLPPSAEPGAAGRMAATLIETALGHSGSKPPSIYGDGRTAERILRQLANDL